MAQDRDVRGNDSHISNAQLVKFYDKLIRKGLVNKKGAAYERWAKLTGAMHKTKRDKIKQFFAVRRNKDA